MNTKTHVGWRWRLLPAAALLSLAGMAPAGAQLSVAREWNELLLESIRNDFARPTIHARNLYHVSTAMWDAWATYDPISTPNIFTEDHATNDPTKQAMQEEAISYASYRMLRGRFGSSPGFEEMWPQYDALMATLGYDINVRTIVGNTPAAVGNRIATLMLAFGLNDGSNEANGYANQFYEPVNPPLVVALPGNPDLVDPDRWQPLALDFFIDQAGQVIVGGFPPFLSPEWGVVTNFALDQDDLSIGIRDGNEYWYWHDQGPPPLFGTQFYKDTFALVSVWSGHLDPSDGVMWDISPAGIGNAELPSGPFDQYDLFYDVENGGDWGTGWAANPVTGLPYTPQIVPRGDYARILAEFWADGPASETPPGHWFTVLNYVSDHPLTVKKLGGVGPVVDDLEWDVKAYIALGGAMHDAAVSIWGMKGWYDYIRPISAIRYMADLGQSSEPLGPSYHPDGIPLIDDFIEVVTVANTAPGEKMDHLAGAENLGKIALYAWRGPDFIVDPETDVAGVDWILAENWWSYQRPTFVTPPFAGFVSGHSGYSRTAGIIMEELTGSPYFPGGLGEFFAPQNEFLVFEDGPSVDCTLQWASYQDASDQTSLSRIWGGIHPSADDIPARFMGEEIGPDAFAKAFQLWGPQAIWEDLGNGLGGVLPAPLLQGFGALYEGQEVTLQLTGAWPNSPAFLILGIAQIDQAFKGGVLVPSPDLVVSIPTNNMGQITVAGTFPAGGSPGDELFFQYWVTDPGGPVGYSASNGLRGEVPNF